MRAMILAAGYGTRLWPLTVDRTKPALPVMGRPLVGYVAEYLGHYGYQEVVVNLHHRPESVRAALGDGSRFGVRLVKELARRRASQDQMFQARLCENVRCGSKRRRC